VISARGLAEDWSLGGEKNSITYSLVSVFIIIIVIIITIINISSSTSISFLPFQTVFISTHDFYLLSTSPPHPCLEKGRGE